MTQKKVGNTFSKRRLLGVLPFAFIVAFVITCGVTYPELIPHSRPFSFDDLPYCINDMARRETHGRHNVLLWTPERRQFNVSEYNAAASCEYQNCEFTHDRDQLNASDTIVFYDPDLDIDDLPERYAHQRWVFYSRQAPPNSKLTSKFDGMFNWSMSYTRYDDVHVPFFQMCRNLYPEEERNLTAKQFAAVWFTDECHPTSMAYVNLLQTEFPIHIVGPCSPQGFHCANLTLCMERLMPLYKFVLVVEKSICSEFVTDQLRQVLQYDVIPIVWGGADYSEILPKGSFVAASEYSKPKELSRMLYRFHSESVFRKALDSRRGVRAVTVDWRCRLCKRLNEKKSSRLNHPKLAAKRLKRGRCKEWKKNIFRRYKPPEV